ncbi:suppressor of SWI4 1 homolog [Amphiura filiformis]|uniref:suppressor of SWI4 1 homolog n=1 Tax=Amphiura filiformis TaxID=82378 RepID=UPI003B22348A
MARKKGKARKAARKNLPVNEDEFKKAPHTFVFHRGVIGKNLLQLMLDMRRVMEPYTAATLRSRRKNVLKDFVSVAGPLGVSHFISFSRSDANINMRIMRVPRGPTVTFRMRQYCLTKDIQSSLKKPNMYARQFQQHPLLVLNNFSKDQPELKLAATLLQNMFPSINVHKVQLSDIRRCVLFNYDPETKLIEFRHYSIKVVPAGMSKSTKKLMQNKVPNLGRYQDVSDFFLNAGQLSESEAELDGEHNEVTLPQAMASRGNMITQKSAIRLVEIGPRMKLQLVKIEEGLCQGEVIFHQFVSKTQDEVAAARNVRRKKKQLKENRKKNQDADIERKEQEKAAHRAKCVAGMLKKKGMDPTSKNETVTYEDDDDTEYYRKEVGEEPDPELFPQHQRGGPGGKRKPFKRDFSSSRKKFKGSSKPGTEEKGGKASTSKPFSPDKWNMKSTGRPKGRVMNKRTVGKGKPGMQGSKGKGNVHGGKGKGQVAKFKFKMSKSKR